MIELPETKCTVFDFAGTLSSEPYFRLLGQEALAEISNLIFGANSKVWADPWMRGELTYVDIANYLSTELLLSSSEIVVALLEGCKRMQFHSDVFATAKALRQKGARTALVTINMDVFSEVVISNHGLDKTFDLIVNSADYGTLDKRQLWECAFKSLKDISYADSVLIDDSAKWCDEFEKCGGISVLCNHSSPAIGKKF